MRLVKENGVGPGGAMGTDELNKHKEPEKERERGGIEGEGHDLEENELNMEDANSMRSLSSVTLPSHSQVQRVCWERFLSIGSPKVLLVEGDDSTRHVLTALLRNCSYQVIAVSNGIEAWKILEDLKNQIDLVLTEVVTSGMSGIGLLSKIMNHKTCHNIPVVMMSTHDSMAIVLKCLSKGAVDYLVKPIRKNEIKNLWQHVWRRFHSSSGSGSESCIKNEHCTGTKCAQESDNGSDSDNEDDNRSIGLQAMDGSDHGSGTQNSWIKRAAKVGSLERPSAQVLYPMPETFASSWMPGVSQEHDEPDNELDNVQMGKDLEIGVAKNTDSHLNASNRKTNAEKNKSSHLDLNLKNNQNIGENMKMCNDHPRGEWIKHAMILPREDANTSEHHRGNLSSVAPPVLSKESKSKDRVKQNVEDFPSLELSLKRLGDDPNILGPSQVITFTRYNSGSSGYQGQTGDVGSCSPPNNSSDAAKQSNSNPPNQISNGSSNNNTMGSTTNRYFTKPSLALDKEPGKFLHNGSDHPIVFEPMKSGHKASSRPSNDGTLHDNDTENHQCKAHHHHNHHNHDNSTDRIGTETWQCGSPNSSRAPTSANVGNCSLNGSNNGSNFVNGSSVVNADGKNLVNEIGVVVKGKGPENGSGSGSGVGVDKNCSAQREAALTKFRLKRKERCFDKRVRYQGRKKLADQRPRVRGQFVSRVRENKGKNADS